MASGRKVVKSPSRPPTRERVQTCTHLQLTRLFDERGCDQCSVCHRRPQLGWLYRCTQDYDGFLPASDFHSGDDAKHFDLDAQLYTLSPSITKAAAEGKYTDEELGVLWKQKIEVRRTIRQIIPTMTSSAASTASSSQYSLPASTTNSTIRSLDSDPDTELSQLTDYVQPSRGLLEPIKEVHDDLEHDPRILPFAKVSLPPPCSFKVCQACRPIYQQRAWQSLNGVLTTPYRPPPKHETANRRISDAHTVKHIGLRTFDTGAHDRRFLSPDNHKRNSRTQFQDLIQQLLRERERCSEDTDIVEEAQCGYELKRVPAEQSLSESATKITMSDDGLSDGTSRASSTFVRPLYHRSGSERTTSIQPPLRKAESHCAETEPPVASLGHSGNTRVTMLGLRIDTAKANDNRDNIAPPQKTPTDSIKESLCRLSGIKRSGTRFAID